MNGPRHMAPPRPVRRVAVLLTVWVVLFAGVSGAACSMAPRESPPPSTVSDRCGETGVCEGSAGTDHPGCDVPGVVVFDLDGRRICDGGAP